MHWESAMMPGIFVSDGDFTATAYKFFPTGKKPLEKSRSRR